MARAASLAPLLSNYDTSNIKSVIAYILALATVTIECRKHCCLFGLLGGRVTIVLTTLPGLTRASEGPPCGVGYLSAGEVDTVTPGYCICFGTV